MSCPNYENMKNFPLFVLEDFEDEGDYYFAYMTMREELEELNRSLLFHKIGVESGHYYGMQLTVNEEENPNDLNNDECRYYFDMYRSVAIRRYNSEINKINRMLSRLANLHGFAEVVCTAIFGNGEALYAPVSNPRARLKAAVCGY